jgi:hypothetical protein
MWFITCAFHIVNKNGHGVRNIYGSDLEARQLHGQASQPLSSFGLGEFSSNTGLGRILLYYSSLWPATVGQLTITGHQPSPTSTKIEAWIQCCGTKIISLRIWI